MENAFQRTASLFGEDAMRRFFAAHVAVFGVGIFYLTLAADKLARGALYRGALTPQPPVPDEDEGEGPLSA